MALTSGSGESATVLDTLRKRAAQCRRGGEVLQAAAIELGVALIDAAGRFPESSKRDHPAPDETDHALQEWSACCAELVELVAKGLTGELGPKNSLESKTRSTALVAAARSLLQQTESSATVLADLGKSLQAALDDLHQRAQNLGNLSLRLQRDQLRFAEDVRKCDSLSAQLEILAAERGPVVERGRVLLERLQLAQAGVAGHQRLEKNLREEELRAARLQASVEQLESELEALQNKLELLQAEQQELPQRIKKTRELLQQLEQSPFTEVLRGIQEIWRRLPLDQIDGSSP